MKLEELMNKVMSTAQQVGTKATEIGKGLLSTTKVNFRLMELNSQVEADYKAAKDWACRMVWMDEVKQSAGRE